MTSRSPKSIEVPAPNRGSPPDPAIVKQPAQAVDTDQNLRPVEDIISRIKNKENIDPFNFTLEVWLPFLTYEQLKYADLMKESLTEEEWTKEVHTPYTRENVTQEMREYMPFAWEKAQNQRGLSANRSLIKMQAWMWLLMDDEGIKEMNQVEYAPYGEPVLEYICKRYDFPMPDDRS